MPLSSTFIARSMVQVQVMYVSMVKVKAICIIIMDR